MAAKAPSTAIPVVRIVYHIQCESNFDPPRRYTHKQHFLALFLRAQGFFKTGPQQLPAAGPYMTFLPAGDSDLDGLQGRKELWSAAFDWPGVAVKADGVGLRFSCADGALRVPRWRSIGGAAQAAQAERFARLKALMMRQDLPGRLESSALLLQIFAAYAGAGEQAGVHRALARFVQSARDGSAPGSIESAASEAGVTPQYLRELCRRTLGVSPLKYRSTMRLFQARELLSSTNLSVKEAARRCGYADPFHFSRAFKRQFGIAPSEIIRGG